MRLLRLRVVSQGRGVTDLLSHNFLSNNPVIQTDGVDNILRTKSEQHTWLHDEQWEGYSNSYLSQFMQYAPTYESSRSLIDYNHRILYEALGIVHRVYGPAATWLARAYSEPLSCNFRQWVNLGRKARVTLEKEIDRLYPASHPTVKTLLDTVLVKRYYTLEDMARGAEKRRENILNRLTPEYVAQQEKLLTISQTHLAHLKSLARALEEEPLLGLLDKTQEYDEDELAMLRQKATYFRSMRKHGTMMTWSNLHP